MNINVFALLLLASTLAQAEVSPETVKADCQKITNLAAKGQQYYQRKQYAKARIVFEEQVAWSESCEVSKSKMAEAYNNVALTYVHQKQYLKAQAWLNLAPKDQKSIFNLNKIKRELQQTNQQASIKSDGEYWQYAGKSLWNVISIKKEHSKYTFNFSGFYATPMTMYYGPNMGDFSTVLDIENGHARYTMAKDDEYLDCVYDFKLEASTLSIVRVSGDMCGFGHNVSAEGEYQKVKF